MRASMRRYSVMSSCVETQPPSGHRLLLDGDDAAVVELPHLGHRAGCSATRVEHLADVSSASVADVQAVGHAMLEDRAERRAGLGQVIGQAVHPGVGRVADDQLAACRRTCTGLATCC